MLPHSVIGTTLFILCASLFVAVWELLTVRVASPLCSWKDLVYTLSYLSNSLFVSSIYVFVAVWELLTARVAFKGLHYGAIIEHVALLGERPPMPEGAPEDFRLLMSSCWHADPQQRPAFDQVGPG
jgi:hypothetical protein